MLGSDVNLRNSSPFPQNDILKNDDFLRFSSQIVPLFLKYEVVNGVLIILDEGNISYLSNRSEYLLKITIFEAWR